MVVYVAVKADMGPSKGGARAIPLNSVDVTGTVKLPGATRGTTNAFELQSSRACANGEVHLGVKSMALGPRAVHGEEGLAAAMSSADADVVDVERPAEASHLSLSQVHISCCITACV